MDQVESGALTLRDWLAARIMARGPIPFAEFMAAALTHPELGYYMRPGTTTGATGDFYTSPDVHPAFGLLVSRQVAEIADRSSDRDEAFELIEMGPGTGRTRSEARHRGVVHLSADDVVALKKAGVPARDIEDFIRWERAQEPWDPETAHAAMHDPFPTGASKICPICGGWCRAE